ncbi:uncharacterized protein B0I36DRAFT_416764 [Microdochium trichocladiopsis]|uniref:Uncharacterized protein n=1 Tax=Microdochium trichocladiopsis TaxID=1682393 RepID=A0A9P9BJ50_9PEZI|nr:uncharacterized protein B0I36DRAFT_416764 [Microdochium trichocladiopsis]KAH7024908.1 hypothetical protein B0I36DRAFT_416764 [Microdochium trichocladiopsis]
MSAYIHPPQEPIAIIGSGCRFPGDATSPSKLWELLSQPRDVSKRVPERSFNPDGFYHPNGEHHGASNVAKSYFIEEDPRLFDSVFFNISPREAEAIDPQQRLLLETVYEAMESSGLTLKQLQGSLTSAFVGIMTNDYTDTHARDTEFFSQYQATGTSRALSSNRLSYFFDWKGPSMTVDTACSSSLAAIHLALQSLRSGESTIACAAGANLLLGPDLFIGATSLHMISPSGRSQMWDAGADGYARGEGIAAVFLKTLSQALRDGDRIDMLIRETGVNSDGRTKGITLPSPEAQATLIRSTYKRAGLDLLSPLHRPQYFEAHGTGTQAGDPREASAIKAAFFPEERPGEKIFVGSIKTVIGHTEGCAGIAGVLKAMLAMQNRTVPPNQHLKLLNPKVEESYANLQVPQEALPWPDVAKGHPLRASVNSFGFGGTNAHAILESYVPELHNYGPWGLEKAGLSVLPKSLSPPSEKARSAFTPFPLVLSANSEKALLQIVSHYAELLRSSTPDTLDLLRLAWTLQKKRTILPYKITFSGTSTKEIIADMQKKLAQAREAPGKSFGQRATATQFSRDSPPRILGVFTGQGAQWPQMGRHLILQSETFRSDIRALEESLRLLPDAPSWSLEQELSAGPESSRLSEAALSQPLCTAVQVALCNLLDRAGIRFHTVVGHSSGEIGAAYAAGRISATDAIRIAYYRGVHAIHAGGSSGQKGSMIAVGFGIDEAKIFCSSAVMKGRLTVAASNSPSGVTLSGDEDAVKEAKALLDERGLFNRVLQVDTAYHSHHMAPCADVYVQSLLACGIEVQPVKNERNCTWVSSVHGSSRTPGNEELKATYWRDNMVQTVLFSQAVDEALDLLEPFDFAIEVGPHPALRGPALQTIKAKLGRDIPYSGVLDRKKNDVTAFSDFLSSIWMTLGPEVADLAGYTSAFVPDFTPPAPLADLPTYPWQHETILWRESRLNKQYRLRTSPPHELLGVRTPDDTPHEMRWRNLLKLDELAWLSEHRIQGQIIVPGAAYCIMALEAGKVLAKSHGMAEQAVAVELRDLSIEKPIALDDASEATETLFSLRETDSGASLADKTATGMSEHVISAQFVLSAGTVEDGVMRRVCRGEVLIFAAAGTPSSTIPAGQQHYAQRQDLRHMSVDRFYRSLDTVGLEYSGAFRGLIYAERGLDTASGVIARRHDTEAGNNSLPVHPTWLDVSFQALFAALSAPGDKSMWTAFVPSFIRKIRFAPRAGVIEEGASPSYYVDAHLTGSQRPSGASLATITGDVCVYNGTSGALEVLVEDVTMTALLPSNARDDRQLYMRTVWRRDINDGLDVVTDADVPPQFPVQSVEYEQDLANACETVLHDYLVRLETLAAVSSGHKDILKAISRAVAAVQQLRHTAVSHKRTVDLLKSTYANSSEMQLVVTLSDALARILQGHIISKTAIEAVKTLWVQHLHDLARDHNHVGQVRQIAAQISHKHPHMRVLQVGVPANVHPAEIIAEIGQGFSAYTIILAKDDSASGDIVKDLEALAARDSRIELVTLDGDATASKSLAGRSFDVVLHGYQSFVPTSPSSPDDCRTMLVPGGYLIMSGLNPDHKIHQFVAHGMEFLFQNNKSHVEREPKNQLLEGLRTPVQLDEVLRQERFSGIDALLPNNGTNRQTTSRSSYTVLSQATDTTIDVLRAPTEADNLSHFLGHGTRVAIIGGIGLATSKLVSKLRLLLKMLEIDVAIAHSLAVFDVDRYSDIDAVISLADLDAPILDNLGEVGLKTLQHIADSMKTVLWITRGGLTGDSPEQSATAGLWRSITSENAQLAFQLVDFDITSPVDERVIVDCFLRLRVLGSVTELQDNSSRLLWPRETEIVVSEGKVMVPRVVPDDERNGRHNSQRRVVDTAALSGSPQRQTPRIKVASSPAAELDVVYSSSDPVVALDGAGARLQLVIGRGVSDSSLVGAALVPANDMSPSQDNVVLGAARFEAITDSRWAADKLDLRWLTSAMVIRLRALAIVAKLPNRKTSVILGATQPLIRAIQDTLVEQARSKKSVLARVVVVHPESSTRLVRTELPWQTECVFDLSSETETPLDFSLSRSINWWCQKVKLAIDGDGDALRVCLSSTDSGLGDLLAQTVSYATVNLTRLQGGGEDATNSIISSPAVSDPPKRINTIVDWTAMTKQQVQPAVPLLPVKPLSASGLFSGDKTYLLFGLTGQIGRSITEYIIRNGGRYIILASRRPVVNPTWQASLLRRYDAHVSFEAVDITSMAALESLRKKVESDLPPVGGVMNGAMILADGLFRSITLDKLDRVLRPKMLGSRNLDAVFGEAPAVAELDFFVMFSSLSAVIGMPGQSNYAAANMYMVGLAAQRRKRHLVASVVDLGMIVGLGYISRAEGDEGSGAVESALRRQNYMPVGERDLHEILTEAIAASGRLKEQRDVTGFEQGEIITGLAPYRSRESASSDGAAPPVWVHEPKFSHLVVQDAAESGAGGAGEGKKTLKVEIAAASSTEEVVEIVQRYFMAQMGLNVPIIDFGIDSLVAVELRSWFSLETGQDVPVLKILGGATVQQLCTIAATNIPLSKTSADAQTGQPATERPKEQTQIPPNGQVDADPIPRIVLPGHVEVPQVLSVQPTPAETFNEHLAGNKEVAVIRSGPLSAGQARFYLPSLYLEDRSPFNCTTSYQITGPIDVTRLVQALKHVVQRHEILRTVFTTDKATGQGMQSVLETNGTFEPKVRVIAVGREDSGENENAVITAEFDKMHRHVFDLETGDTLRATILSHETASTKKADKHTLIFGYHHIVMDGVSWQSFLADLAECYKHGSSAHQLPAVPSGAQYLDFSVAQASNILPVPSAAYQERLDYWKSEFPQGVPPPMTLLPFASTRTRKLVTEYKTRTIVTHVEPDVVARIRKVAQTLRVTAFHFWLGAFQTMLARLLQDQEEEENEGEDGPVQAMHRDMCIGIVDANRSDQTFAKTIGYLLEVLPVKFTVDREQRFSTLLQNVRSKAYGALARSGVPLEEIVRAVSSSSSGNDGENGGSAAGATPFFQVVFNYRMGATKAPDLVGDDNTATTAKMDLLDYADATTPFDLSVSLDEKDDGSAMVTFAMLDYLYDGAAADAMVGSYKYMVDVLSRQPSMVIGDVPLFSDAMVQEAVVAGTGASLPTTGENLATVSRRIARWAERDPHAIAVKDSSGTPRSYLEVSQRADVIAAALSRTAASSSSAATPIGPGSLICVLTEPSADTVSCILAILRLGAAYVPLDVRNADERLADVLDESGARIVVFHNQTRERAMKLPRDKQGVRFLNLSILDNEHDKADTTAKASHGDLSRPEDTAFVLYTSGSTGKPKGIALTNANMATQNASVTQHLDIGREIVLQQSGLGFDASLCQIFMCLCNGGTLVMGDNRNQDPAELAALVAREGVTFTICMMSEMAAMLRHGQELLKTCTGWRLAMCAGEAFPPRLAEDFAALELPGLQVVNAYGPTEGTIMATIEKVEYREMARNKSERVLIGEVIPEYGVYIIDRAGNPLPRGHAGEIALAGPGVARGYLHNPKLTTDKFMPDTFSHVAVAQPGGKASRREGWDRVYRTGDKGRLVEGNKFLHLGRMDGDSQVKLRGIRIELQDIRHGLLVTSKGVLADAAIVLRSTGTQGNEYLAAFVVFANDEDKGASGDKQAYLRDLLRQLPLPPYMRPAVAVPLEGLPVTGRGKLDTKLLSTMPLETHDLTGSSTEEEILTETEQRLREVWQQVLTDAGVAKEIMAIKKDSDFFSVGGNSLLLMQLRVQIRRAFEGVDIPLIQLFQSSSLAALAARIAGTAEGHHKVDVIDWEKETQLDEDVKPILHDVTAHSSTGIDASVTRQSESRRVGVLLTGATGFLGSALLSRLAADPRVSRIHCVAVRGDPSRLTSLLPPSSISKIIPYEGDLSLPRLGMTTSEVASMMADIDVVIHNGATVSHLKSYQTLKAANLGSTKELVRLVAQAHAQHQQGGVTRHNKIPIHYISTGGIARLSGLEHQPEASLAAHPPPVDGTDGYVATKWASERLLELLHTAALSTSSSGGWPITIHRPSSITSRADMSSVPASDITHNALRYSRVLRAVPDFSGAKGAFDFIDVETIVTNIVDDIFSAGGADNGVVYRHQSGEMVVPADGLGGYLEQLDREDRVEVEEGGRKGYAVHKIDEWVKLAVEAGMDPLVGSFLAATEGRLDMPLLVKEEKV